MRNVHASTGVCASVPQWVCTCMCSSEHMQVLWCIQDTLHVHLCVAEHLGKYETVGLSRWASVSPHLCVHIFGALSTHVQDCS